MIFNFHPMSFSKDLILLIIVFQITNFGFLCTFSYLHRQLTLPSILFGDIFFIFTFLSLFSESSFFLHNTVIHNIPPLCFLSSRLTTLCPATSSITCMKQASFDFVPSRLEDNIPKFGITAVNSLKKNFYLNDILK